MKNKILFALVVAMLMGCQSMPYKPYARKVQVQPNKGGVVAMYTEHRDEDRAMAEGIMSNSCSNSGYSILEEGEVVVGTVTNAKSEFSDAKAGTQVGSLWGIPLTSGGKDASTQTSSETSQKKEWQIKYECKNIASSTTIKSKKTKVQ